MSNSLNFTCMTKWVSQFNLNLSFSILETRNSRGKDRLFLRQGNPVFDFLVGLYEGGAVEEVSKHC